MWNSYRYTDPVAKALTEQFGTEFALYNTGGGCICLHAVFEGNLYVLIGSGVDGPLWRDSERAGTPHGGGYGVGVYDDGAAWTGQSRAYVIDPYAETGERVGQLVREALDLARRSDADPYVMRTYDQAGIGSDEIISQ